MAFEFDAEKYKKASTHQKEWGKKLISELNLNKIKVDDAKNKIKQITK